MNANEYQEKAHSFAQYKDAAYPFFGLAEEAGEVCGKVAKHFRKVGRLNFDSPDGTLAEKVKPELGDVLWFVAEIATTYGWTLEEVMQANIDKLEGRKERGTIIGEGDNR